MAKVETKFSKADKAYKQVMRIREKAEHDALTAPAKIREKASEKIAAVLAELDDETRALVEGQL